MQSFPDRVGQRTVPPDGVGRYLDTALADAATALGGCAEANTMPEALRAAVRGLERRTVELRAGLNRGDVPPGSAGRERETLAGFSRSVLRDAELAGLFDAFRERCRTLGGRMADATLRDAALAELDAALPVLARSVGLAPGRPGGVNWIPKPSLAAGPELPEIPEAPRQVR